MCIKVTHFEQSTDTDGKLGQNRKAFKKLCYPTEI